MNGSSASYKNGKRDSAGNGRELVDEAVCGHEVDLDISLVSLYTCICLTMKPFSSKGPYYNFTCEHIITLAVLGGWGIIFRSHFTLNFMYFI